MTRLQVWMDRNGKSDTQVAAAINLSRVQVNRLRRGKTGTRKIVAKCLQKLTGIPWHHFIGIDANAQGAKKRGKA